MNIIQQITDPMPMNLSYIVLAKLHCCRMVQTRHYDQRPFDETMCDAIITNGGVKNPSKRCKTFAMDDTSNTIQILVACAMRGIRLISMNCLRWDQTTETGSQIKVCTIYGIQFTLKNRLRLWHRTQFRRRVSDHSVVFGPSCSSVCWFWFNYMHELLPSQATWTFRGGYHIIILHHNHFNTMLISKINHYPLLATYAWHEKL